jgi:hypothetical protein
MPTSPGQFPSAATEQRTEGEENFVAWNWDVGLAEGAGSNSLQKRPPEKGQ